MENILQGLNASQLEAVTSTEGFIRVIAGAGSGKTRALARRFAYLVNEIGILPGNILCVTFTNKSANEMRQRIHNLTGDNDTGYISTFHSFCVSVLQEDSHALQYPKSFLVLDNSDIDSMLKIIYEERGLTLRNMTFSKARDIIEIRKLIKEPEYYLDMLNMSLDTLRQKYLTATEPSDIIFYGYLYQEKKCFGLDYNDLIKFTLYIFEQNEAVKIKWQQRLEYIMIDEFQDIDELQYKLMSVLCGYHKNLFIVGDPDQTIYTWRGANVRYLLDFDKIFPSVKTIMMMQNYRSTPQIVSVVNDLIDKNKFRIKKNLMPTIADGRKVICHHADTSEREAMWIAEQIQALHGEGTSYREITVLYRAHYITRIVEEVFLREKIPYAIYSGVQFFNRMEIKDALAYLRLIAYKDDLAFLRVVNVPKRNLGERRIKFLQEYAVKHQCSLYIALETNLDNEIFKGTKAAQFVALIENFAANYAERQISELLAAILNESGYEKMLRTEGSQERLDNLAELKQSVYEYETSCGEESTLEHYLSHVALFTNNDAADNSDKVKLMTVHSAKGLEFPYVFLCAMNEGVFPSKKTDTIQKMEEERRLAFVAMTRAQKRLYLSEAEGRNFDGSPRYPSRFLLDIEPALLDYTQKPQEGLIRETKDYLVINERYLADEENQSSLAVGQRVKHSIFGSGTVVDVDLIKAAHLVKFDNIDTPRSISFRAKLEKD
ncbi:UvrD-helicase domain-containing protein [Phascolarctobacterium faecium]|uniref:ATP-dependent helicase n=1 Tax=Phascolarctobacterium faecium TaxID=33025 RepID=UPI002108EBD1|nr:UvrD-helicase domain-containing protein [Phascolarctobacterium faecium]MCQ4906838.1 UvrD-helicase domain-containing protein [Phascolarctobacterium faecium]